MSLPNSADFALLELLSGSDYNVLCGMEGVTINRVVQTSERYVRDCAKPNRPGNRRLRATGKSFSIGGTGFDNIDLETAYADAFGVRRSWRVRLFRDDGTDSGELLGAYTYTGILTARTSSWGQDADATSEISIEGEGELVWQPGGVPVNALLSPIDDRILLSPIDGRILLRAA